jgi:RNA polymerase sigma factor for flagellar operon FliA
MKHVLPACIEVVDLESAGHIGLVRAAQTWKPERGVEFSYYCRFRIRGAMLDHLRQVDPVKRWRRTLESRGEVPPETVEWRDTMAPAEERDPGDVMASREFPDDLVRSLNDRERVVLHMRYVQDMEFQEIAPYLNVSPSRISQIHRIIKEKARAWYGTNGRLRHA